MRAFDKSARASGTIRTGGCFSWVGAETNVPTHVGVTGTTWIRPAELVRIKSSNNRRAIGRA